MEDSRVDRILRNLEALKETMATRWVLETYPESLHSALKEAHLLQQELLNDVS